MNGGWIIHDEATPEYQSIIDQMTTGQEFLYDKFGIIPEVGWQIESYGHSSTTPSLFAMLGLDTIVTSKLGDEEKSYLTRYRNLNFIWEGHQIADDMSNYRLFTHPLAKNFEINYPFQFMNVDEFHCNEPFIDHEFSEKFFAQIVEPNMDSHDYTTDITILYGGENFFTQANTTYYCIDNYMAEIQRLVRNWTDFKYLTYHFATIEDYLAQVNKEYSKKGWKFPYFKGDFLPYDQETSISKNSDNSQIEYWTGLYSTHPVIKQQIRDLNRNYRVLSSIFTINYILKKSTLYQKSMNVLKFDEYTQIKRDTARMLHHDTISGTHPHNTYALDFNKTIVSTFEAINNMMMAKMIDILRIKKDTDMTVPNKLDSHHELKFFIDGEITKDLYPVSIFNPSLQERTEIVNLTIEGLQAAVFDQDLDSVASQLTSFYSFEYNKSDVQVVKDNKQLFLHFEIKLKPMETKVYFVRHIFDEED